MHAPTLYPHTVCQIHPPSPLTLQHNIMDSGLFFSRSNPLQITENLLPLLPPDLSPKRGTHKSKKEAWTLVWECERFSTYVIGKPIMLETDHKPLVSLLGKTNLDSLSPRACTPLQDSSDDVSLHHQEISQHCRHTVKCPHLHPGEPPIVS
jgi:hypothetical protein